jgi:hypothetical protein
VVGHHLCVAAFTVRDGHSGIVIESADHHPDIWFDPDCPWAYDDEYGPPGLE